MINGTPVHGPFLGGPFNGTPFHGPYNDTVKHHSQDHARPVMCSIIGAPFNGAPCMHLPTEIAAVLGLVRLLARALEGLVLHRQDAGALQLRGERESAGESAYRWVLFGALPYFFLLSSALGSSSQGTLTIGLHTSWGGG